LMLSSEGFREVSTLNPKRLSPNPPKQPGEVAGVERHVALLPIEGNVSADVRERAIGEAGRGARALVLAAAARDIAHGVEHA